MRYFAVLFLLAMLISVASVHAAPVADFALETPLRNARDAEHKNKIKKVKKSRNGNDNGNRRGGNRNGKGHKKSTTATTTTTTTAAPNTLKGTPPSSIDYNNADGSDD